MKANVTVSLRHNAPFWFWLVTHKLNFFVEKQKTKTKRRNENDESSSQNPGVNPGGLGWEGIGAQTEPAVS